MTALWQGMISFITSAFSTLDYIAVNLTVLTWLGIGWIIENPPKSNPSVTKLVAEYRRDWMVTFLHRTPRIFDAQILNGLRQGTAFLASTSILTIGGLFAVLGNPEPLRDVVKGFDVETAPLLIWQIKLGLVGVFLVMAFLKFVWANRLFGYCSVIMASVPNSPDEPHALPRAKMAGEINIRAAMNFNRGLRSMYFALTSIAWLVHPAALITACVLTAWTLYAREFKSLSRQLMEDRAEAR